MNTLRDALREQMRKDAQSAMATPAHGRRFMPALRAGLPPACGVAIDCAWTCPGCPMPDPEGPCIADAVVPAQGVE